MAGRRIPKIIIAATASGLLILGTIAGRGVTASGAPATSTATEKVIVILHNQLAATPVRRTNMLARTARANQAQAAVLDRLAGRTPSNVVHYSLANAFTATVTTAQAAALAADPAVASVVKDAAIALPRPTMSPGVRSSGNAPAAPVPNVAPNPFAICPTDPSQPLVEPEALASIKALTTDGSPNAQELTKGKGVKVAYIADGIDPDNPDFIRPNGSHVIIDYKDFSGDGPDAPSGGAEAFGDASSIAAQGTVSHDLSNFVNQAHPLPPGCNIRIVGVAPAASIVALKAGGEFLTNSSILQSIDYAVRVDHVNVINESFGLSQFPDDSNRNTLKLFNHMAVAAGVTVVESTGDGGITSTIGSDAQDAKVISVGGTTDFRLYAQTTYAAQPFSNGHWADDNISALSSSGFTQFGRTLDVVAPGEANWAVCEPGFLSCANFRSPPGPSDVQPFGGTSESAPLTAGVAALVISAYRSTHNGASPTPAVVKRIITGTAGDLGLPADEQGAGLVNARAAAEAALTWPGSKGSQPSSITSRIVTSKDQMNFTGEPSTTQQRTVTITNVGKKPLTVAAGVRGFSSVAQTAQAFSFDSNTLPSFVYYNGQSWAVKQVHFSVPTGAARLLARMAWAGSRPPAADAVVRMTLLAPDGTFMGNSRPQGGAATANYANVDIRKPQPGTWTAIVYSIAGSAGYSGVIGLSTTSQRAVPVGSVSPSTFSLQPGAQRKVTVAIPMSKTASGDQSDAVTFATSAGQTTAVSAVVRTLIPTSNGGGDYEGVITGGNARAVTPGETFSYEFDVPSNRHRLYVSTTFQYPPNSVVDLVLIDPNGELSDVVSNLRLDPTQTGMILSRNIQSFTANPVPGRWHMVIVVQNPVSGTAFETPFTGRVGFRAVGVDTGGLPSSPDTQSLSVAASSTTPAQLELQGSAAGFDLFGDLADAQNGNLVSIAKVSESGSGNYISRGIWFTNMQQIGPFTDDGAPAGETTITASMRTLAFDQDVSSSTGDPYGNAVDPNNNGLGTPVRIPPNTTRTLTVTFTPSAARGTAVSGVLNLVTPANLSTGSTGLPFTSTGEVVATVPYAYTVR